MSSVLKIEIFYLQLFLMNQVFKIQYVLYLYNISSFELTILDNTALKLEAEPSLH